MPLAGIAFFDRAQKMLFVPLGQHFSGQNRVFVGRCGGASVVYPSAGSSNQRPALQSDSEPRGSAEHSTHPPQPVQMMTTMLTTETCWENDDSVFFFFWEREQETLQVTGVTLGAGRSY